MTDKVESFLNLLQISNAPTTYTRKRSQLKAFLRFLNGKAKHYCDVTKETVETYLMQLPGCQQSKQQCCQVIKEFYDYLADILRQSVELGGGQANPASEIKFLHPARRLWSLSAVARAKADVPSASVVQKIITLTGEKETSLDKRNALMVELAYGSGLRRTELLRLNVEDVDLVERTVHVWGKGNKDRIVPITEAAVNALREYLFLVPAVRGPLLRSCREKRLAPEQVTEIFKKKIGIRPHLFRHACAVHMLKAGCNIRYIQKMLGHERLDSTQIYTRIDKENLRQVIESRHPRTKVK